MDDYRYFLPSFLRPLFCNLIVFLMILFGLSSCGYHPGDGASIVSDYQTISVPYITGDTDGSFTAAVVRELVKTGNLEYRSCGARLCLCIKIVNLVENNIGFRYDRKKYGELTKDIIPTETRLTLVVEVMVTDSYSGAVVIEPIRLTVAEDFDHDYYFSRNGVNVFSLGQLTDIDAALDAVSVPLQNKMAKKIVDYVMQSW